MLTKNVLNLLSLLLLESKLCCLCVNFSVTFNEALFDLNKLKLKLN